MFNLPKYFPGSYLSSYLDISHYFNIHLEHEIFDNRHPSMTDYVTDYNSRNYHLKIQLLFDVPIFR